jgi:hypothetical protein
MERLTPHGTSADQAVEEQETRPIDVDDRPAATDEPATTTITMRDEPRRRVLRIPRFSLLAPIGGWLAAWGAATLATAALLEAGVSLGFGFGIADGSVDLDTGFWAGLWTLVIQGGAFVIGGYVAGRMARVRPVTYAVLAWAVAMAATAADAIVVAVRDGGSSVLAPLGLPQWAGLDYENSVAIPLVIFALGALVGAVVGGWLALGANRRETTEMITAPAER